jgi:hypothetical protein
VALPGEQGKPVPENEVAAVTARNGLAFAGKNAIAAPDPAPDTIWR